MSFEYFARYGRGHGILTQLNAFDDVLNLIESLASSEYLQEILRDRHSHSKIEAKALATRITPYMRATLNYIEQSRSGPKEVSFLPSYYALLSMAKMYILAGKHASRLEDNRHHGLSDLGHKKDSQKLLSERIKLLKKGTFGLFYQTICDVPCRPNMTVSMSDVYKYIHVVGAEFRLATGCASSVAYLRGANIITPAEGKCALRVEFEDINNQSAVLQVKELKILRGFKPNPHDPKSYVSPSVSVGTDDKAHLRKFIRNYLVYDIHEAVATPISTGQLLLPEEAPIFLAFFQLSNVVRYRPEFFDKLHDSRYWPMVSALRMHGLYRFMILFWSYMHQERLVIRTL